MLTGRVVRIFTDDPWGLRNRTTRVVPCPWLRLNRVTT